MVVTRREKGREEGEVGKDKQIHGGGRKPDFGRGAHSRVYRSWITILYTWKLYNVIKQCYPDKLNKKKQVKSKIIIATKKIKISMQQYFAKSYDNQLESLEGNFPGK